MTPEEKDLPVQGRVCPTCNGTWPDSMSGCYVGKAATYLPDAIYVFGPRSGGNGVPDPKYAARFMVPSGQTYSGNGIMSMKSWQHRKAHQTFKYQ